MFESCLRSHILKGVKMNLKTIMLVMLGITATTESFRPLSKKTALEAVKLLNNIRSNVSPKAAMMPKITYDFQAQAKLDAIIASHDPRWLFEVRIPAPPNPIRQNMNGYYISQDLGFPEGFQTGWHDTCKSLGQNCILINLRFREAQKSCFVYNNCNATAYNRFRTCGDGRPQTPGSLPCSYTFVYYPNFVNSNVTKIACAVLNVPGWAPPPGQLNSYWCYTDGLQPSNDLPYEKGKPGSICKKAPHKLCA
jgi:hypothetical protein